MKTYEDYVEAGKRIVGEVEDRQMRICAYAIEVCTIRHGGRSDKFYTMKDYAADIGLNNKTLNQWMLVYRNVVLKLSKAQREKMTWRQASKVNENLEEANTIENRINGTPRIKTGVKRQAPPERVQRLFDETVAEKPFISEFLGIVKQAKHCSTVLKKRDLSIIQDSHLLHLMEILDESSDVINDYLTSKVKKKVS